MSTQIGLWRRDEFRFEPHTGVVFTIRESGRARHLRLQTLPPRTVELVVPKGFRADIVRDFVREHRDWIDRAGREMISRYPEPDLRPTTIELRAIDQAVAVRYRIASGARTHFRYRPGELDLFCRDPGHADCSGLLRRWLLGEARRVLRPWLEGEARQLGFAPARIHVRLQKTRWGSCSASGAISINAALLLVRPALVRYLFIHELAHLQHLSHSRAYWQAVARLEPGFEALDRELARSWSQLPAWLFALTHGDAA